MNNQDKEAIEELIHQYCNLMANLGVGATAPRLREFLDMMKAKDGGTTYRLAIVKEPGELPVNPYPISIFPTTLEEASQIQLEKLGAKTMTAVNGAIGRYIYQLSQDDMSSAGYFQEVTQEE